MRYRSADAIGPEHVGARVTVRRLLPDGMKSDVIGTCEAADADAVSVRDRHGTIVRIARDEIVAARVHPIRE